MPALPGTRRLSAARGSSRLLPCDQTLMATTGAKEQRGSEGGESASTIFWRALRRLSARRAFADKEEKKTKRMMAVPMRHRARASEGKREGEKILKLTLFFLACFEVSRREKKLPLPLLLCSVCDDVAAAVLRFIKSSNHSFDEYSCIRKARSLSSALRLCEIAFLASGLISAYVSLPGLLFSLPPGTNTQSHPKVLGPRGARAMLPWVRPTKTRAEEEEEEGGLRAKAKTHCA